MISRFTIIFSILLLSLTNAFAGDSAPGWLTQAAAVKAPTYEKDVTAVVLRNEKQVTLDTAGKLVTV